MCGRYSSSKDPQSLVAEFDAVGLSGDVLGPDHNVAPTKDVYAVIERVPSGSDRGGAGGTDGDVEVPAAQRKVKVVRWGLVPGWAKDLSIGSRMINARSETLAEKPAFKRAFARRRCILPADGFYEWYTPEDPGAPRTRAGRPVKQPYFIHAEDGSTLPMAGLYELWRDPDRADDDPAAWVWSATVITTTATDDLGRIHDRAPMLVERDAWDRWLDPALTDTDHLTDLLVPAAPGRLVAYPVSIAVNDVRNNGPELLDPLPAEPALAPGPGIASDVRGPMAPGTSDASSVGGEQLVLGEDG